MNILEIDKLALFIIFVIPGFISIKFYQLVFPGNTQASSEQIIDAVFYSSFNYAVFIIPIIYIESSDLKNNLYLLYYLFYISVFIVAPVFWVLIWKFLRTRSSFQKIAPHPTSKPWDYLFNKRHLYWMKVMLKDGSIIGGLYAEDSFTSSSPEKEQIYLQEAWILNKDGGFERKKNDSEGVIILSDVISHIELQSYERGDGEDVRHEEADQGRISAQET